MVNPSYFFIVNPNANAGSCKQLWLSQILPWLQEKNINFSWSMTSKQEGAIKLAQQAKQQGFEVVVAVGGDGTINEVVNGIFPDHSTAALACLPTGTGCDFVKTLQIERKYTKAITSILKHKKKPFDVGVVECEPLLQPAVSGGSPKVKRYFINSASFGLSAEVAACVNRSRKLLGRTMTYWVYMLKLLLQNKDRRVSISYNDEAGKSLNIQATIICNGKFCGSGMLLGPGAKVDDGLYFVNEIKKASLLKTLRFLPRLFSGNFHGLESFLSTQDAKKIVVQPIVEDVDEQNSAKEKKSKSPIYVECDGEVVGTLPATFYFEQRQLDVVVGS